MSDLELKLNHVYRAKKPRPVMYGFFQRFYNDRQIIYIGSSEVQYDSLSVRRGRHYPTMSIEAFKKWAGVDVTAETPSGDWNLYDK